MTPMTMVFNGLRFEPLKARQEGVPTQAHGYYAKRKWGIHLYKPDGSLEAHIVMNRHNEKFVVSASLHEGVPRYMFSTSTLTERWLQMEGMGPMAEDDAIKAIQFH